MVGSMLWVARPEIQQRYSLPSEVSQEVLDWLAAPPPPPVPIPTKGKRSSSQSPCQMPTAFDRTRPIVLLAGLLLASCVLLTLLASSGV